MKIFLYILLPFLFCVDCLSQIDTQDSTFSIIANWNKGDRIIFSVVKDNFTINGVDTVDRSKEEYLIYIVVEDSTANSYLLKCKYLNISYDSLNEYEQMPSDKEDDLKILIKTNNLGVFEEVVNWHEIKRSIKNSLDTLKAINSDKPNIDFIINQAMELANSKKYFENATIDDISQFICFNGLKFKFNQMVSGKVKAANLYGGEQIDANFEMECSEVDTTDDCGVLRLFSYVDSNQATEATYNYLNSLTKKLNKESIKREEFPQISIQNLTESRIDGYGNTLYSCYTRTSGTKNFKRIENRYIELMDLFGKEE